MPLDDQIVEIAKNSRSAPGATLMAMGVWAGQNVKQFPEPYIDLAVGSCLVAFWMGMLLLVAAGCTQLIDWVYKD